jgi:ABC-type spermidine/putrescine transport system permease subunit I
MKNSGAIFIALEFMYETTPFPVLAVIPSLRRAHKVFYEAASVPRSARTAL